MKGNKANSCLYKKQQIIVQKENGLTYSINIKDAVNLLIPNKEGSNKQWLYKELDDGQLYVYEDNELIPVTTVYKRKYNDKIYDIRTSSGRRILCSKDHKLLTKIKRQDKFVFVPAEELHVKDRLCSTVENLNINKDDFDYLCGAIRGIIERHIVIENNKYTVKIPLRYVKTCSFIKNHLSDIEYIFGESISIEERFGFLWFNLSPEAYNEFQNELPYYDDNYSLEFSFGFIDGFIAEYNKYVNTYCVRTDNTDFILFIEKMMLGLGEINRAKELLCYPGIYIYFIKKKYYNLFNLANDEKMSPNKERELYGTISNIKTFDNDDNYVYELETETHHYSVSGYLCHNCGGKYE